MAKLRKNGEMTRRGFLGATSAAVAGAGLLRDAKASTLSSTLDGGSHPESANGRIALEEHFVLSASLENSYAAKDLPTPEMQQSLVEIGSARIAEMDRGGLDICILSLTAPGVQAVPDPSQAIVMARKANDHLAEHIAKFPKRMKGFAALPMQDPQAAALELTRCIKELGFCGALVNGFSQLGAADSAVYYDLPQYRAFWATVQELDVPFYLHPRSPLATRQQGYEGHAWMVGSPWGFSVETSIHALRLMGSGLFDEFPKLKIVLGHLGEGIPFGIWRVDHRIQRGTTKPNAKRPLAQYLHENFYITTSGNFRNQALMDVIAEIGTDRVLYSVDFPYEDVGDAKTWFDQVPLGEADREKIGRTNALKLFHLS